MPLPLYCIYGLYRIIKVISFIKFTSTLVRGKIISHSKCVVFVFLFFVLFYIKDKKKYLSFWLICIRHCTIKCLEGYDKETSQIRIVIRICNCIHAASHLAATQSIKWCRYRAIASVNKITSNIRIGKNVISASLVVIWILVREGLLWVFYIGGVF